MSTAVLHDKQFGAGWNTESQSSTETYPDSHSPKHSKWSMGGSKGKHAKSKSKSSGSSLKTTYYTGKHAKGATGYTGKHTSGEMS